VFERLGEDGQGNREHLQRDAQREPFSNRRRKKKQFTTLILEDQGSGAKLKDKLRLVNRRADLTESSGIRTFATDIPNKNSALRRIFI